MNLNFIASASVSESVSGFANAKGSPKAKADSDTEADFTGANG
jgi:hypothetical protein